LGLALTGNLAETPFVDLIQFYCLKRETVAVRVKSARPGVPDGVFYLERGELVDARFGDRQGLEAVREGLKLRDGAFRVDLNVKTPQRTIFDTWKKVLLEESWRQDEEGRMTEGRMTPIGQMTLKKESVEEDSMNTSSSQPPYRGPSFNRQSTASLMRENERRIRRNLLVGAAAVTLLGAIAAFYFHWSTRTPVPEMNGANAMPVPPVPAPQAVVPPSVLPLVQGVTEREIVFGQAVPLSGAAKELGRQMKTGVEIAFAGVNEAGGVNGRKLRLVSLDDGYEPSRNQVVMKELAETQKVFGFIGNVGTPTAAVAIPYALEKKMLFFGAFTGASLLRKDPPDRYVFNYRASYAEETAAAVKYLIEVRRVKPSEIAVFAQSDKYGDAGFEGVAKMLRRYHRDPNKILRVGYERNTADVHEAVTEILRNLSNVRAVVMVPTYKAAAQFVMKLKDKGTNLIFTSVSFVGSNALAEELMQLGKGYAEGVIVTQVVPLPDSKSTAVMRYQEALQKYAPGERPDFVSLEGYIAGNLMAEALKRAGPEVNTETLVNTLEGIRGLDLGLGAAINYGPSEHQASHKVWGAMLDAKGVYQNLDLD
jgi:ABC-type branched-subunit amino acid transport system substrate-binding protein